MSRYTRTHSLTRAAQAGRDRLSRSVSSYLLVQDLRGGRSSLCLAPLITVQASTAKSTMTDIVDDVKPATGEEAAKLQQNVMKAVTKEFGGDQERLKGFTTNTKAFGNGALSATSFMAYMRESFGATRAERFTPSLARLISDPEKRRQLLAAARQRPAVDEDVDSDAAAAGAGLSQQLQQLAIAHREGIITEEQKASAKDELIRRSFQESDSGTSPAAARGDPRVITVLVYVLWRPRTHLGQWLRPVVP